MDRDSTDILARLLQGHSLHGLGLPSREGRFVVGDLRVPAKAGGNHWIEKGGWRNLHFVGGDLSGLKFQGIELTNCVFERCRVQSVGFWKSTVTDCQFLHCDLRHFAPGGIDRSLLRRRVPNRFLRTAFDHCDLRESAHSVESYEHCRFLQCRWNEVDLMGARFEDCVFTGPLTDLIFRNQDPSFPRLPKNQLLRCDFQSADISTCRFIGIDMKGMRLPETPDLLVLPRGPEDWREWLRRFESRGDQGAIWWVKEQIGSAGTPCVASRSGLLEIFSEEDIQALEEIVRAKHV